MEITNAVQQVESEIETLQQLWLNLLPSPAPSHDSVYQWLTKLSFFECGKLIHKTQRLHEKYERKLRPSQLLTFCKQQATLSMKEKTEKISNGY